MTRIFLFLTAAVSGAAVMVVEILGANMLSPYVGTSHFVWSAQISVTLLSLALGYYGGGWIADRSARPTPVYVGIICAAFYLIFATTYRDSIVLWYWSLPMAWVAFLSSFTLFFLPLTLLATVGPFLVKFVAFEIDRLGSQVGAIIAVGTLGSLCGTFLISYVMVPLVSQSVSMYLTSAVLFALAAWFFLFIEKAYRKKACYAVLALVPFLAFLAFQGQAESSYKMVDEIYRRETHYGLLQILENHKQGWRVLLTDYLVQNQYSTRYNKSMSVPTYVLYHLARFHKGKDGSALCIGLGAGIVPRLLHEDGIKTDVVEINPEMIRAATKYFYFPGDGIEIIIDDARHYLNEKNKKYSVIVLDAFMNDGSLFHLMTREAFLSMFDNLENDGCLVINTMGDVEIENDYASIAILNTLSSVFSNVKIYASPFGEGGVYFVASMRNLSNINIEPSNLDKVYFLCRDQVLNVLKNTPVLSSSSGIILTDEYNPAPFKDANRRESLRRHFFNQAKNL